MPISIGLLLNNDVNVESSFARAFELATALQREGCALAVVACIGGAAAAVARGACAINPALATVLPAWLRLAESSSAAFLACPTAAVRRGVQAAEFQAPFVASSLALIFERLAGCDRQLALA